MKKFTLLVALVFAPMGTEAVSTDFLQTLANPGELWLSFPAEGAPLTPLLILGSGLKTDNLVFVGIGFSPVIWGRSVNLPLIGSISVAITTVPLLSASGNSELFMKDGLLWGAETNRLPFNVL
ncbi:MAG: hypothetical protein H8E25_10965 [Planctomycetes bacterium]|nr:hypothetical protein [Planctomycetota bacterium]